jgi:hypothetical protein
MQQEPSLSRRALLAAVGGLAATGVAAGDDSVDGGTMSLTQAYNTAGDLWQGPDSAKSNVDPDEGRLYVAVDTQVEYYGDGSAWVKMGVGSQAEPVPSVSTEKTTITETPPTAENAFALGEATFATQYQGEPTDLSGQIGDPIIFHKSHYSDDEYRVITHDSSTTPLWRTPDFASFTQISSDILGDHDTSDGFLRDDGTYVIYCGGGGGTEVFSGSDLTSLSPLGTFLSGKNDAGVFYDSDADTVHIYTEDSGSPSTNVIYHHTTPASSLLSATQQSDAIDTSNRDWKTGDPDLIELGGYYYMFIDRSKIHPQYRIALFRSPNLHDWELVDANITAGVNGGDMVVTRNGPRLEGLTEFAGPDTSAIGHWRLYPTPDLGDGDGRGGGTWVEDANSPLIVSGQAAKTYNLAACYDQVKLEFVAAETQTRNPVNLRLKGDSGTNYNARLADGSYSGSIASLKLVDADYRLQSSTVRISGLWTNRAQVRSNAGYSADNVRGGENTNITEPLDNFEVFNPNNNGFYCIAEIYGKQ